MKVTTPERWAPLAERPDYEVSDQGNVRSWRGPHGRRLKPHPLKPRHTTGGYKCVSFYDGEKQATKTVHTLVLNAFVGPKPDKGMECRHLNGDNQDNRLVNLKWGTKTENSADTRRHRGVSDAEQIAAVMMARRGVPIKTLATALGYTYTAVNGWVKKMEGVDFEPGSDAPLDLMSK